MANKLLIHYSPGDPDNAYWSFDGEGKTLFSHGTLSDIGKLGKGLRATVLLDSSCLNLEQVQVPSNNRQRQLQAIPFALEDNLASDIEDSHFAIGKKQDDENIPVITIDKALLENILSSFKSAGITIECLSADLLALPDKDDGWSVLVDNNRALIKTGAFTGLYCDRSNLQFVLNTLIRQHSQTPASIQFYYPAEEEAEENPLGDIETQLESTGYQKHPLNIFSRHLDKLYQLNILQGHYAVKRESSALLKPWKAVASLAAVWIVLQLSYAGIEARQLSTKNQQLTAQIEKEFKRANPGAKKFHNIRNRMERQLKELRGGGGDMNQDDFLKLLSLASPALASNKKVSINAMVYRNKHIDMELQADSLQSLENIKSQLTSIRGLKTLLSTSVEKNKVSGRLRLEKQG